MQIFAIPDPLARSSIHSVFLGNTQAEARGGGFHLGRRILVMRMNRSCDSWCTCAYSALPAANGPDQSARTQVEQANGDTSDHVLSLACPHSYYGEENLASHTSRRHYRHGSSRCGGHRYGGATGIGCFLRSQRLHGERHQPPDPLFPYPLQLAFRDYGDVPERLPCHPPFPVQRRRLFAQRRDVHQLRVRRLSSEVYGGMQTPCDPTGSGGAVYHNAASAWNQDSYAGYTIYANTGYSGTSKYYPKADGYARNLGSGLKNHNGSHKRS